MVFFLLFGVAIFSYILGILQELLMKFDRINEPLDQGEELNSFFNFMQHYNYG